MLTAFVIATVFITLAELGDKTQLLALCLAARYKAWQVLVGIFAATLLIHLLSTVVGAVVGNLIPKLYLSILTGVLFIGFGIWTLRGDTVDEDEACETSPYGPILATGIAFFLAELGDKTQIMTMTIAANPAAVLNTLPSLKALLPPAATTGGTPGVLLGVWLGSTVGMMIADGVAILIGSVLGAKLPERLITRISGVIFVLFGIAAIAEAFLVR